MSDLDFIILHYILESPWKHCDQGFQQLLFANITLLYSSFPVSLCVSVNDH